MKNFIIGVVVGVVLASTGAYAVVAQKAVKAAYYVYNYFSKHQRERGERKQLKVTLHKQYLLKPSEEILTLYEGKLINGEPLK